MANEQTRSGTIRTWDGKQVAVREETVRARVLLQERMTQMQRQGNISRAGLLEAEAHFDGEWDNDPQWGAIQVMDGIRAHGAGQPGSGWRPVSVQTMIYLESTVVEHPDGQIRPVSWDEAGVAARGLDWDGRQSWRRPEEAVAARAGQVPAQGFSSQAGLAASQGPQNSYPSVPKPGQPGSRFNPMVRERPAQPARVPHPDLIQASDVPAAPSKAERKQAKRAAQKERQEVHKKLATEGIKGGVTGAQIGAKAGSVVPGLGTAAGTAIGAAGGASLAQAKVGRESGDPKLAFRTAMPLGGIAGGAINAKLAADVRDRKEAAAQQGGSEAVQGAQPTHAASVSKGPGKKLPVRQRAAQSKVGQVVQSESFKAGAKRVGAEALRDAAASAGKAKQSGSTGKGVVASAAKGALSGVARGVGAELAARKAASGKGDGEKGSQHIAGDLVSRTSDVVQRQSATERETAQQSDARPLSERYDYRFEDQPQQQSGDSQLGR